MSYFTKDSVTGADCLIIGQPTIITSPWSGFSSAMQFDGVNRGISSWGVDCGNTSAYTIQGTGSAATFTLEAKVKTGAVVNTIQAIAGRYQNAAAGGNGPVLYLTAAGKFAIQTRDVGGTIATLSSTSNVAASTLYDVAGTYDGTTMRIFVNGTLENSVTLSGVETPNGTCKWMIGRDNDDAAVTNGGVPWPGVIEEVRLSNVARYTSSYTPSTSPFSVDGNTLGLWHLDSRYGNAGTRGPDYYINNTQVDGAPSGGSPSLDLRSAEVAVAQGLGTGTLTGAAGVNAAATVFQITGTLNSTTLTGTSVPNATQANGKGWQIPATSGMAATSSVVRVIPAGSNLNMRCRGTQANVVTGTISFQANFYKRTSAGTLTFIATAGNTTAAAVVSTAWTGSAGTGGLASDVVFNSGDTLFAEVYCTVPGQTVAAATTTFILDSPWTINTPTGIEYRTSQSVSTAGTGSVTPTKVPGKKFSVGGTGVFTLGPRTVSKLVSWTGSGTTSILRGVARSIAFVGSGSVSMVRQVGVRKLATGFGSSLDIEKVILLPKVAIGVGTAAVVTQATRFKAFFVTGTGSAAFARAVTVARSFAITGSGAVSAILGIPQVVLNRISSGSVVKKILYLFDDN